MPISYELLGTKLTAIEATKIAGEKKEKQTELYNKFIGPATSHISAQELINHVDGIDPPRSPIGKINYTLKLLLLEHRVAFIQKLNRVTDFCI